MILIFLNFNLLLLILLIVILSILGQTLLWCLIGKYLGDQFFIRLDLVLLVNIIHLVHLLEVSIKEVLSSSHHLAISLRVNLVLLIVGPLSLGTTVSMTNRATVVTSFHQVLLVYCPHLDVVDRLLQRVAKWIERL